MYLSCIFTYQLNEKNMKTARKQFTTEELQRMLTEEIAKIGEFVWSDRRKTIEEMLKMRGIKL
jgi:hypothetical protein